MGNGEGFYVISAGGQPRPWTLLQIFQEAAKLFWWSRKPMFSISLILLVPHALLFLCSYLLLPILTTDFVTKSTAMSTKDPSSPEFYELLTATMKSFREFAGAEVAIPLVSFLSSSFLLMAAVHTVAMAGKGEQATTKGLLCRIRRTWKGPVATQLYVAVIYLGSTALFFLLCALLVFISSGSIAVLVALGVAVSILALLLLIYLQVAWNQALVISVVEEGCYGLAALGRAAELTRGRRRLGFCVNLLLQLVTAINSVVYYLVNSHLPPAVATHLVCGLAATYAGLLVGAFQLVVFVVFYYECKRSRGEEEEVTMKEVYTSVPTAPTLDGDLP